MPFDVFLSHSERDYDIVRRVWDLLNRINISAYMYELYPQYGELLPDVVRDAIAGSRYFVTFLTKDGVTSQWVNQEIGVAHALRKLIIPIIENGVKSKGFIELRIFLPFSPSDQELMLYQLVIRLRELLFKCNSQRNGLQIKCVNCGDVFLTDLPSCEDVSHAYEKGLSLRLKCPSCSNEVDVNPLTFDEIGL